MLLLLQQNMLLFTGSLVEVPDVTGETQAAGTAILEGEGFVVQVSTAYSSTVASGLIISHNPTGGANVLAGSTVVITVSLGEAPPSVPGNIMVVAEVSPEGLTKWVDYIPVLYVETVDADKLNTYDDDGAIQVITLESTAGLVAGKDYIPVVSEASPGPRQWTYDDSGYIRVIES